MFKINNNMVYFHKKNIYQVIGAKLYMYNVKKDIIKEIKTKEPSFKKSVYSRRVCLQPAL